MNNMGFAAESHKISELAATVPDNGDCYFVTAFSGLFAPYWIDDAKGTIFGITAHTQKGHIARATLEATCFQTKAILDAMEKDSGKKLAELAVDGGMSNSDLCMQVCQSFVDHGKSYHKKTTSIPMDVYLECVRQSLCAHFTMDTACVRAPLPLPMCIRETWDLKITAINPRVPWRSLPLIAWHPSASCRGKNLR